MCIRDRPRICALPQEELRAEWMYREDNQWDVSPMEWDLKFNPRLASLTDSVRRHWSNSAASRRVQIPDEEEQEDDGILRL